MTVRLAAVQVRSVGLSSINYGEMIGFVRGIDHCEENDRRRVLLQDNIVSRLFAIDRRSGPIDIVGTLNAASRGLRNLDQTIGYYAE